MDRKQEKMAREDEIRQVAHELWEAEGRPEGHAEEHWSKAEQIVAAKELNGAAAMAAKPQRAVKQGRSAGTATRKPARHAKEA